MRMLVLTRYDKLGASSRLRSFQYLAYFRARGAQIDVASLFSDEYLALLYSSHRRSLRAVFKAYWKRIKELCGARHYDLVWIEKELLPYMPAPVEIFFTKHLPALILDYDDAIFHRYDQHKNLLVRVLLGKKIDVLMRHACAVTVGNAYLAQRAREAGAQWVEIIPTAVDLTRYHVPDRSCRSEITVGWIGSPSTASYLHAIAAPLALMQAKWGVRVCLIGSGNVDLPEVKAEVRPWNEDSECEDVAMFDIGVMPLTDSAWERGKCGYKLIQYMAAGMPVIASPVGVNCEIVRDGYNGFLAQTTEQWNSALETLIENRARRLQMGLAGRAIVKDHYCISVTAPKLFDLFLKVSGKASRHG